MTLEELAMTPTWIVLADEGRARMLARHEDEGDLVEVDEITDAAAHADNADLRRDAYGRRTPPAGTHSGMPGSNTESAGEEKLDHEAELFARRVADHLTQAHRAHRFEQLHVAAAPRFLGRLRQHLDDEVRKCVVEEVDKDLLQLDRRELTLRFFPGRANNRA
jgi:protein required for attachment to host cells